MAFTSLVIQRSIGSPPVYAAIGEFRPSPSSGGAAAMLLGNCHLCRCLYVCVWGARLPLSHT